MCAAVSVWFRSLSRSDRRPLRERPRLELLEPRRLLATYTVTSTADSLEPGTLRWAILQAENDPEVDSIHFELPRSGVRTIRLLSPLPILKAPVVLDATTQPEYAGRPLVVLDGSAAGPSADGLVVTAGASVVRGLAISGFAGAGIVLTGGGGNVVAANYLGTTADGLRAAPNGHGVLVVDSSNNQIGGLDPSLGNLISGNRGHGIWVRSDAGESSANRILGNRIGTNRTGLAAVGNELDGIRLSGVRGNLVGGVEAAAANIISGNLGDGVVVTDAAAENLIQGNLIGTTADGVGFLGNQNCGIRIADAVSTVIGGPGRTGGNVIAANLWHGVEVVGESVQTKLEGNFIGVGRDGLTPLGNQGNGITLASNGTIVGGPEREAGNHIAYNGSGRIGAGVQVVGNVSGNSILSNSIHDNAGLGISLGYGPTPNHPPGSLTGPNEYQNYPLLVVGSQNGRTTTVRGSLWGKRLTTYVVQLFANRRPDGSGFGEGERLLGSIQVRTDAEGQAQFDLETAPSVAGAFLSATATDPAGNTSEFSPAIQVRSVSDLVVAVEGSPNPVGVGGEVTFRVSVLNVGLVDATNVVLNDQISEGLTILSTEVSQGTIVQSSSRVVTVALGRMTPGSEATVAIRAKVLARVGETVANTATVTLDELDENPADNTTTTKILVAPVADLGVDLAANAGELLVGDRATYRVVATNRGPAAAANVRVDLMVDSSLTILEASQSRGSVVVGDTAARLELPTLEAGGTLELTVTVRAVQGGLANVSASIRGDVHDPATADNLAVLLTRIVESADVAIQVEESSRAIAPGEPGVFSITASNRGPGIARDVVLSALLPDGTVILGATSDQGSEPIVRGNRVETVVEALEPGASVRLTITVVASLPEGSVLVVRGSVAAGEHDPELANNETQLEIPVRGLSRLSLEIRPKSAEVAMGQPLAVAIVVTNDGPADEPMARLGLPLGNDFEWDSGARSSPPWSVGSGGLIELPLGPLRSHESRLVELSVRPRAGDPGPRELRAWLVGDNAQPGNQAAETAVVVAVLPSADLALKIVPQFVAAFPSAELAYLLEVSNLGPSPAAAVRVSSPLPAWTTFLDATLEVAGSVSVRDGAIIAELGEVASGESVGVMVRVRNLAPLDQTLRLEALVASPDFDPVRSNNTAEVSVTVRPAVDLGIQVLPPAQSPRAQAPFSMTVSVMNHGPSAATGAWLELPLPPSVQLVWAAASQGLGRLESGTLRVELGTLEAGHSASLDLKWIAADPGDLSLTPRIGSNEFDLDRSNDQTTARFAVDEPSGVLEFVTASFVVDESAGWAVIEVVRRGGARGEVWVQYRTSGGDARPGVNYQAIAGILAFAPGQTSAGFVVPILAHPHDRGDLHIGLVLENPTGDASLGMATATLRIRDLDPDTTPPTIARLSLQGTSGAVTAVGVTFSEPVQIDPLADATSAFQLVELGPGAGWDHPETRPIQILTAGYDPATATVWLVPAQPLAVGRFHGIQIQGGYAGPIRDLAGNPLVGQAGDARTDYRASFARGSVLSYRDHDGDQVTLRLSGGGYLDQVRDADGQGVRLVVNNAVPRRSVLAGNVARARGRGDGRAQLGIIEGLGPFGEVRVTLTSPPFLVREHPFLLRPSTPANPRATAPVRVFRPLPFPPRRAMPLPPTDRR